MNSLSPKVRGRRESRVPGAPAAHVRKMHTVVTTVAPDNTRLSPRNGFNGLCRALPGDEFLLPPSPANWRLASPGRALQTSAGLTPATGARTTRFCRPQLPSPLLRPAMCDRSKSWQKAFKRRSSARRARSRITALRTPLAPDAAASTATCPNVRDDSQRPSGGTGWHQFQQ